MKIKFNRDTIKKILNVAFFAAILAFVLIPDAKSWLLQQLMSVGLFKAEIKKEARAPEITVEKNFFGYRDLQGKELSTASLKGKVVFINFWASWCPPCRAEMPSLSDLYGDLKNDERFVFLFITEDDNISLATNYLKKNKFDLPLYSRAGMIDEALYSGTLPTTIVLAKDGSVAYKKEGFAAYNTESFKEQLNQLALQ